MAQKHGAKFWQQHVEQWKRSGLTQIAYCTQQGVNHKTFGRWNRSLMADLSVAASPLTLVPVKRIEPLASGHVRLHSPGGWQIEIGHSSVAGLAELLRQLP